MRRRIDSGFTLIELLIVVTIIAVLASIAVPAYSEYVVKGKLAEAFTQLTSVQSRMEQYYQDNRTYGPTGGANCGIGAPASPAVQYFTFSCATSNSGQNYTYTAASTTLGFTFTIDDSGTKRTTAVGAGWAGAGQNCWVRSKGGGC